MISLAVQVLRTSLGKISYQRVVLSMFSNNLTAQSQFVLTLTNSSLLCIEHQSIGVSSLHTACAVYLLITNDSWSCGSQYADLSLSWYFSNTVCRQGLSEETRMFMVRNGQKKGTALHKRPQVKPMGKEKGLWPKFKTAYYNSPCAVIVLSWLCCYMSVCQVSTAFTH